MLGSAVQASVCSCADWTRGHAVVRVAAEQQHTGTYRCTSDSRSQGGREGGECLSYSGGGGVFRAGMISWEIVVFKEGGEIYPWRSLGALAVQCVREAV